MCLLVRRKLGGLFQNNCCVTGYEYCSCVLGYIVAVFGGKGARVYNSWIETDGVLEIGLSDRRIG
jgi:hypothetical protein